MIPSQDLFQLIHSLSKSEKRYFKIFYGLQKGSKNYKCLFDAIAGQKEHDEHSIRKALKGQIKSFSTTKHRLYYSLLRCLHIYHAHSSGASRLYEMLHAIGILFNKGLFSECTRVIGQARKMALLHDADLVMLELLNWEARLIRETGYKKAVKQKLDKLSRREFSLLEKYKSVCKYRNIHDQYHRIHHQYAYSGNLNVKKKFYSVMPPSYLRKRKLPPAANIHAEGAKAIYSRTIGDLSRYYEHCKQVISMMESSPQQMIDRQKQYLAALTNMCIALSELHRFKESHTLLHKIRSVSPKNAHTALFIFSVSYSIEFNILCTTGQFEKATSLVEEVEEGIKRFKGKISAGRYTVFCYAIAYSYFGAGRYSNTIEWSNKIINNPETDVRMDLHIAARLLNLMAHIEKRNWNFAGHLSKSVHKFLEKNKHIHLFENMLLRFVNRKLSHLPRLRRGADSARTVTPLEVFPTGLSEAFKELKPQSEKILKNPFARRILNYIDFPSWIDSKIHNRPFAEIVLLRSRSPLRNVLAERGTKNEVKENVKMK